MGWVLARGVVVSAVSIAACGSDPVATPDGDTEATESGAATTGDGPPPGSGSGPGSTGVDTTAGVDGDGTTGGTADPGSSGAAGSSEDEGSTGGPPPSTVAECYANQFVNDFSIGPDYDQFGVTPGSHCLGTNHQDIDGIERVVFLGDSVTVGSPPTLPDALYRSLVADHLAEAFGLQFGTGLSGEGSWKLYNPFNGQAAAIHSGDFSACAKWGARNDDLLQDGAQIAQCFTEEDLQYRTLVVFTSGGNDINSITQDAIDGVPYDDLWLQAEEMVTLQREAIDWLKEPGRFPSGVFVIFGNIYEFTDGTGEVEACDVSGLAGFDQPVPAPRDLADMVVWIEEEYGRMAAETGTDMVFMLEEFCGHGFNADDPTTPCYRGPNTEVYFDLTCIHPNPAGHAHLASMFNAVVDE
jgi:lysophospholipase L1-like esterase